MSILLLDIFYHPNSLLHDMGGDHLEAPERIRVLEQAFESAPFDLTYHKAEAATPKEIKRLHSQDLFDRVQTSQSKGKDEFTPDTRANRYTFQASLTAVGGSLQTAMNLKKNHSFGMLRPPGHHATRDLAMGFCFFNNIALATKHLLDNRVKKIAILDIDNHHGNGTQELFYDSAEVLYTSLHARPEIAFPGTGYSDETGTGEGKGQNINIPLPFQTNDHDYLFAFDTIIEPIVRQYRPDTILVSLGFDGLLDDPYGALGLTPWGFEELGFRIGKLNKLLCNTYTGIFLEGGYKYHEMGDASLKFFNSLINHDQFSKSSLNPSRRIQKVIHNVRSIQRNYWYAI